MFAPTEHPDPGPETSSLMSDEEVTRLQDEVMQLSSMISAATGRLLALVADFDARANWAAWGMRTPAEWLAWAAGMKDQTATRYLVQARRLGKLPKVAAALEKGEISADKADVVARIASPETEEILLQWAKYGTASQLQQIARAHRRSQPADPEIQDAPHLLRTLTYYFDDDGIFRLRTQLAAEEGEVVAKAIEATCDQLRAEETVEKEGGTDPADVAVRTGAMNPHSLAADALVDLAERGLAGEVASRNAGDRYQVVVHVDSASLTGAKGSICELDAGVGIAPETARRIVCDASLVTMVEKDGVPIKVGRKRRTVPPSLRRAMEARDRGCVFPGCKKRSRVQGHHVVHWPDGGPTDLENVRSLCRFHHRLVHEGGYRMETETDGRAVFFRPNGGRVPSVPPVGSIPETALDQGLRAWRVQPDDWAHDIEPMSLDDALFILHKAEQRSGPLLN